MKTQVSLCLQFYYGWTYKFFQRSVNPKSYSRTYFYHSSKFLTGELIICGQTADIPFGISEVWGLQNDIQIFLCCLTYDKVKTLWMQCTWDLNHSSYLTLNSRSALIIITPTTTSGKIVRPTLWLLNVLILAMKTKARIIKKHTWWHNPLNNTHTYILTLCIVFNVYNTYVPFQIFP
jgi:hypothetical protein